MVLVDVNASPKPLRAPLRNGLGDPLPSATRERLRGRLRALSDAFVCLSQTRFGP